MDKKGGLGFATIIVIVLAIVAVAGYFYFQIDFGDWIKEEVVPSTTCRTSVIMAGQRIELKDSKELPRLDCEKIKVDIEEDSLEGVKKELLKYIDKAVQDFGIKSTFAKITGSYCRRRYHPINFKHKELGIINNFDVYVKKEYSGDLLGVSVPKTIDLSKEYSILFFAVYEDDWGTWGKNLFLPIVQVKYEAKKMGIALIESDKVLDLDCSGGLV